MQGCSLNTTNCKSSNFKTAEGNFKSKVPAFKSMLNLLNPTLAAKAALNHKPQAYHAG